MLFKCSSNELDNRWSGRAIGQAPRTRQNHQRWRDHSAEPLERPCQPDHSAEPLERPRQPDHSAEPLERPWLPQSLCQTDDDDVAEPLERPCQPESESPTTGAAGAAEPECDAAEALERLGKKPRRRFFSLRLSMAAALRWRSPEARADVGILSANDIGQWTSCEVFLAPTFSRNSSPKAFCWSGSRVLARSPHEEPLMCKD